MFKVASEQDPESLGAYVISQGQTASDVLAVMLLQKQFGMTKANGKLMRVVPLFETLDDLNNSPAQLERCKLNGTGMLLMNCPIDTNFFYSSQYSAFHPTLVTLTANRRLWLDTVILRRMQAVLLRAGHR